MPKLSSDQGSVLQRIGSKELLEALQQKSPRRYKELYELTTNGEKIFQTTTTLANRLRELGILRLINKRVINNPGERVVILYEVTETGREVLHLLEEVDRILSTPKI
jgi:DNA-binding HxlR family transcriptional regulator